MLSTEPKWQSAQQWQPKDLPFFCACSCMWSHLRVLILYRCSDTEAGQPVAMATLSTALAADCLSVCVCVCVCVYKLFVCRAVTPMGVSSVTTVKAVNKLGRSDRELGGDWPRWPFGSERRDRLKPRRERERQNKRLGDTSFRGRTNNKADTLPKRHPRPPEALFTLACVPFVPCPCPGTREEEIRQQREGERERDKG